MISEERRNMFRDLYRLAEYYEAPPFRPGDVDGNADWFIDATSEQLTPFLTKYRGSQLTSDLAMAILDDANRQAVVMNRLEK